jgi:hypothetical protein
MMSSTLLCITQLSLLCVTQQSLVLEPSLHLAHIYPIATTTSTWPQYGTHETT